MSQSPGLSRITWQEGATADAESDSNADGTVDARYSTAITNTYDSRGNVLTNVFNSTDGAGIVTDHKLWTFTYDVTGNRTLTVAEI